jgi:hypothetical protein
MKTQTYAQYILRNVRELCSLTLVQSPKGVWRICLREKISPGTHADSLPFHRR